VGGGDKWLWPLGNVEDWFDDGRYAAGESRRKKGGGEAPPEQWAPKIFRWGGSRFPASESGAGVKGGGLRPKNRFLSGVSAVEAKEGGPGGSRSAPLANAPHPSLPVRKQKQPHQNWGICGHVEGRGSPQHPTWSSTPFGHSRRGAESGGASGVKRAAWGTNRKTFELGTPEDERRTKGLRWQKRRFRIWGLCPNTPTGKQFEKALEGGITVRERKVDAQGGSRVRSKGNSGQGDISLRKIHPKVPYREKELKRKKKGGEYMKRGDRHTKIVQKGLGTIEAIPLNRPFKIGRRETAITGRRLIGILSLALYLFSDILLCLSSTFIIS